MNYDSLVTELEKMAGSDCGNPELLARILKGFFEEGEVYDYRLWTHDDFIFIIDDAIERCGVTLSNNVKDEYKEEIISELTSKYQDFCAYDIDDLTEMIEEEVFNIIDGTFEK